MSRLSHTVKAETVVLLQFPNTSSNGGATEVHKQGCAHANKAEHIIHTTPEDLINRYPDDYYYVAPCARKAN